MQDLYLTEIRRLDADKCFRLTWSDGHTAERGYDYVRGYCPRAGCQGHGPSQVEYIPPPAPVRPDEIEPVGNYAVSIVWSDQHATGIYRFDFLREICPCPECAAREP